MAEIRRGITRTVILTRRHAIKLPSLRRYGDGLTGVLWSISRGILANQGEAEWWRNATPDQQQMLCPVSRSWLGGIVNVYPRCQPYEVDEEMATAMFERRFRPLPDLDPQPGDVKPDNYGWIDGRLVVLDYDMTFNGCPHDRSGAWNAAGSPDTPTHPSSSPAQPQTPPLTGTGQTREVPDAHRATEEGS